jgi:hypothetical protein
MQYIGEYIINNAKILEKDLSHSIMQNGGEMDMSLNDMCDELFETIDIEDLKDVVIFPDNVGTQRATLISFYYEGRKCEIGEHFGSQRDYFWVKIYAINA